MAETEARQAVLTALSPYGVVARGFAIVESPEGHPVTGVDGVRVGHRIRVRMADGALRAAVEEVET